MSHQLTAAIVRVVCGLRPIPDRLCPPQAIYFANHSSHLDFVAIWAALPEERRARTRPVAGRDYWEKTPLRRRIAVGLFRSILIERKHVTVASNPLQPMLDALAAGDSLIVFPEGTRSPDGRLQPFKPGLYHLARARPEIPLVPVHLENLSRILPKGDLLPVPLLAGCSVGEPLGLSPSECKPDFLERARRSLELLAS